jgi:hypothetical protein
MRQPYELILSVSTTNPLSTQGSIFVPLGSEEQISRPPTAVGVAARCPQGKPGLNGFPGKVKPKLFSAQLPFLLGKGLGVRATAGRVEPQLNTYLIASGGVELESNSAVHPLNQPKKVSVIFNELAPEVRSERLSHLSGGVELESNWSPTAVNYAKNILSPRSLRSLR